MSPSSMSCFHPIEDSESYDNKLPLATLHMLEEKFNHSNMHLSWGSIERHFLPLAQYLLETLTLTEGRSLILGICGSISAGKTTTAHILKTLLEYLADFDTVEVCSTDGFIYSLEALKERNILHKKGFPESYNTESFHEFLTALHENRSNIEVPIYSHEKYDTLGHKKRLSNQIKLVIVEGLNLLNHQETRVFFDKIIYLNAPTSVIKQWYLERFMLAYNTSFKDPANYFHEFSSLSPDAALDKANTFWDAINGVNLKNHILPFRHHADIIVEKNKDHGISSIKVRK